MRGTLSAVRSNDLLGGALTKKMSFIPKLRAPKNYPQQFANCRPFADAE